MWVYNYMEWPIFQVWTVERMEGDMVTLNVWKSWTKYRDSLILGFGVKEGIVYWVVEIRSRIKLLRLIWGMESVFYIRIKWNYYFGILENELNWYEHGRLN